MTPIRQGPSLEGCHVLLTGATGFLGQAVLERLLSTHSTTRVTVLVRPQPGLSPDARVDALLAKPVFDPWRERVGEEAVQAARQDRVRVLDGDLGALPELPGDVDVVLHSASSVSFDPPIDEAFQANVAGPASLYRALLASGADPHVVHVSTSYVAGLRKGVAEERSLDHRVDHEVELQHALASRSHAEAASRRAPVLRALLRRAQAEHRRAGPTAVALAAEDARRDWVRRELVEAGRARAHSLGWADVYTFTKALGERVAETTWGAAGHRLTVVRPTVIESALRHPYPGWIDGFKVTDPMIVAYGRGLLPEFPALADAVIDVIPVDYVVNAVLAAAAAPGPAGQPQYFQVGTGITNPLSMGKLLDLVNRYFTEHPLADRPDPSAQLRTWSFRDRKAVERALHRRQRAVCAVDDLVSHLPASEVTRRWISTLHRARRDLGNLRQFLAIYQPYSQMEAIFDNARTRALHASLPQEQQIEQGFDVSEIDWDHYLVEVHVPAAAALITVGSRPSRPSGSGDLAPRRDVLAVFDLQRTVAAATLVEQYLWVELAAKRPGQWVASLAGLVSGVPGYLMAEQRDRGDFIRLFMRRYAGVLEDELREVITTRIADSLRGTLLQEGVRRVREHRQAGHRTVLLTGEIDVFVEPLAHLFDDVVAGSMEKDVEGRWTGHLATPPLVGEARVAWLRRYARERGMDLAGSYAYGDSYADRAWLEAVGHPNAVNPDARLYRHAKASRWPVHSWTTTGESRLAPVVRSVRDRQR